LEFPLIKDQKSGAIIGASTLVGGTVLASQILQPANAAPADLADVTGTITALTALAGAAVAVALLPMGVRLAIKTVNRLTVKG
jgi:hypothetical protein